MTNNSVHNFLLYGDNFLECERFVDEVLCITPKLKFKKEAGKYLDRPILVFQDTETKDELHFHMRPRFDAWKSDTSKKYSHENLDVFLFQIKDGKQLPILAVEYDDATQAGNQAWQRGNRAYDAAVNKIPYMYFIQKETIEFNPKGEKIAIRHPPFLTPLVPITLSCWSKQISLLITTDINPNKKKQKKVATIVSYLIRRTYCRNTKKPCRELQDLYDEILKYTRVCPGWDKKHIWKKHPIMKETSRKLNANIISMAILYKKEIPNEIDLSKIFKQNFISANFLHFTKLVSKKVIERKQFWTDVYNKLVWKQKHAKQYQKIWGAQVNQITMPIGFGDYQACLIINKPVLKTILVKAYPSLKSGITRFINSTSGPVVFHLLAGYKNTEIGGTSRPDTGWLAFVQSLFPSFIYKKNTMVIIYSNGVPLNWHEKLTDGNNEFWNSVTNYTGYVIVDKYQNGRRN